MALTIWHNPRCSKSRAALALIEERGLQPEIFLYLETPPSMKELQRVLALLKKSPWEIARKSEDVFKSLGLDNSGVSDTQLIEAMSRNPVLIERPIVINGDRAALGRPPETVLDIL
jgi:arsenate reductase